MVHATPLALGFSKPLHGLRGVAACVVVLGHAANLTTVYDPGFHAPPGLFNGSAAVVLFFVLSGIVLAPSALAAAAGLSSLVEFYVRRAARLMPLMVVTNLVAAAFVALIHNRLPFPEPLTGPYSLRLLLLGFVGATLFINGPAWSIFVELIGSVLMPALAVAASRRRRWIMAAVVAAVGYLNLRLPYLAHIFLFPFFVGSTVRLWAPGLALWAEGRPERAAATVALVMLFLAVRPIYTHLALGPDVNASATVVLCETLLITPALALCYATGTPAVLGSRLFQFLGDVSFGLYLIHFNVVTAAYTPCGWQGSMAAGRRSGLLPCWPSRSRCPWRGWRTDMSSSPGSRSGGCWPAGCEGAGHVRRRPSSDPLRSGRRNV